MFFFLVFIMGSGFRAPRFPDWDNLSSDLSMFFILAFTVGSSFQVPRVSMIWTICQAIFQCSSAWLSL